MDIPLFVLVRIKQKQNRQMYMEVLSQFFFFLIIQIYVSFSLEILSSEVKVK